MLLNLKKKFPLGSNYIVFTTNNTILTDIKILSNKLPSFMRNVKGKGGHKSLFLSMRRQLYILCSKIYMPSDTEMRITLVVFRVHI